MEDARYDVGSAIRREVLGDHHVDRAAAAATPFSEPFYEYITRSVWGEVWNRDGLDRRTRRCITLAVLAALGSEGEIELHVRAAVQDKSLSADEICEILLHIAPYAGVPAANLAFAVAQRTLASLGELDQV